MARLWETQDDDPPWSYLYTRPGYTSAWWYPWHDDNVTLGLERAVGRDEVPATRVSTCLARAEDARWSWVVYVIPVDHVSEKRFAALACGPDLESVPAMLGVFETEGEAWRAVRRAGAMGGEDLPESSVHG
ncbi:hypothetical protein [uncultured Alsobacter sp.]|uniref:hypothetical protein n=1 Tax=uncultured Alsobacter sp. TaxID=1748258 RepID=UPI0025FBC875|nr:hypothetical protein [uncultured Alsobacter sp.]